MERLDRLAENERRIREINEEAHLLASDAFEQDRYGRNVEVEFLCACGRAECDETILLTVSEYEKVHRQAHRFIIVPGHETAAVERVVELRPTYAVVEKLPTYQAPE